MSEPHPRQGVLLEAGTNELEVLIFSCGSTRYGVNVAKVREVIAQVDVTGIPKTHPAVLGVFKLREAVIPLVDLHRYFASSDVPDAANRNVILMEFNDRQIGFLVDQVDHIVRMSWEDVRPMPTTFGQEDAVITSVCEVEQQLVLLIDFEKIAFDISGDRDVFDQASGDDGDQGFLREGQLILLAEDSPTIRKAILRNLTGSGYHDVTAVSDGQQAWDRLEASLQKDAGQRFAAVVTDIEMPCMDGLHLCKRIKDDPELRATPVVVFSSLVSDSNLQKCRNVGADAAITKPQMGRLVQLLDTLLNVSMDDEPADMPELLSTVP